MPAGRPAPDRRRSPAPPRPPTPPVRSKRAIPRQSTLVKRAEAPELLVAAGGQLFCRDAGELLEGGLHPVPHPAAGGPRAASPPRRQVASGSVWAPPGGSGMISSTTPRARRSGAVIFIASAASAFL